MYQETKKIAATLTF